MVDWKSSPSRSAGHSGTPGRTRPRPPGGAAGTAWAARRTARLALRETPTDASRPWSRDRARRPPRAVAPLAGERWRRLELRRGLGVGAGWPHAAALHADRRSGLRPTARPASSG